MRRGWTARGQEPQRTYFAALAMVFCMPKNLVIAKKPSVGRGLAGALEGPFQRHKLDDIKPKKGKKEARGPQ